MEMRKLVIGDIHGALKALKQVLERSKYNPSQDQLIFLGDYTDGWSQSSELIEYLIQLEKEAIIKPIFIRGNHDVWCENWLHWGKAEEIWVQQGGQATIDSYLRTGYLSKESHRKFFRNLYNYYIDEDNNAFLHGGFSSYEGLGNESYKENYYWDRELWSDAMSIDRINKNSQITKSYRSYKYKEVFIGHTSTLSWKIKPHLKEYNIPEQPKNGNIIVPMNRLNIWNMDTGAGWFGKLTAMDINNKELFQSDLVQELYKREAGRR